MDLLAKATEIGVPLLICIGLAIMGVGVAMVEKVDKEFRLARWCFWISAGIVSAEILGWEFTTDMTAPFKVAIACAGGVLIFFIFPASIQWVNEWEQKTLAKTGQAAKDAPKVPDATTSVKPPPPVSPPKLHDLFTKDFPQYFGVRIPQEFTASTRGGAFLWKHTVETTLCCAFESKSKFLVVYVPDSPNAFDVCRAIPQMKDSILQNFDTMTLESQLPTEDRESSKDLVFTGKVYVYYESNFSRQQLGELDAVFRNAQLEPQFRGQDWITYSWMAKKPDPAP